MMTLGDLEFKRDPMTGRNHAEAMFPNGWGVSVLGTSLGDFEVALLGGEDRHIVTDELVVPDDPWKTGLRQGVVSGVDAWEVNGFMQTIQQWGAYSEAIKR